MCVQLLKHFKFLFTVDEYLQIKSSFGSRIIIIFIRAHNRIVYKYKIYKFISKNVFLTTCLLKAIYGFVDFRVFYFTDYLLLYYMLYICVCVRVRVFL